MTADIDFLPLTLAEALAEELRSPNVTFTALIDLHLTAAEIDQIDAAVRRFQWLCGLSDSSPTALLDASREDVTQDMKLLANLSSTGTFADWFSRDDASIYRMTDVTGSEDWADVVLTRCIRVVQ